MNKKLPAYLPVLILFCVALLIGMLTYQDYSVSWDEQLQREPGVLSYEYVFHGSPRLFETPSDNHGAGFELLLVIIEKWGNITKSRDIYLMRHLVSHIVFLLGMLSVALLALRLFGSRTLSCLCFIMLVCMPRIYAHSFFNSKDVPFLAIYAMTIAWAYVAFSRNRPLAFVLLGLLGGYATSIRIMGILLFCIIIFFLLTDLCTQGWEKRKSLKTLLNTLLFSAAFCFALYISWPYLWRTPVHTFAESLRLMSKYVWDGNILTNGKQMRSMDLPWTYFPIWFGTTTPILWLATGCAGVLLFLFSFFRAPLRYFRNTRERNFLFSFLCFIGPIASVVLLHSVIYDDWRHLYFVYPPFVLLAIYFIDTLYRQRQRRLIEAAYATQMAATCWFMGQHLPLNQVFFNAFVPHGKEYIRTHYEMDYWGCSYRQGLEYLLKLHPYEDIKVTSDGIKPLLIHNNMLLMEHRDADRIKVFEHEDGVNADYFITNFRGHTDEFPYPKVVYSIKLYNSTVLCVYKMH